MHPDLVIRNGYLVIDTETEIASGWIALCGTRICGYGQAGEEPRAGLLVSWTRAAD